jgi:hypothetical protein
MKTNQFAFVVTAVDTFLVSKLQFDLPNCTIALCRIFNRPRASMKQNICNEKLVVSATCSFYNLLRSFEFAPRKELEH